MSKELPKIISVKARVLCICGEVYDFDADDIMPFGVQTSLECEGCDQKIAVDAEVFAQYLTAATA